MKYNLQINQKKIVDSKLKIDLYDACILDFMYTFSLSPSIEKKLFNNKLYCWFKYSYIVENLPLLNLKKDSVYRRVKSMTDQKLLEPHPDNQVLGKSFFHITEHTFNLFYELLTPTDENPYPLRSENRTPTDVNPDNSINKDYNTSLFDNKEDGVFIFLTNFNTARGSSFKVTKKAKWIDQLRARLKDGYTSKQIMQALKNAMADQYHIDNQFNHLTPEFMTRQDKLEKYLNYKAPASGKTGTSAGSTIQM